MGFLKKLFGKKQKSEETPTEQVKAEETSKEELKQDARNITLEDVEKEVKELDQYQTEETKEQKVPKKDVAPVYDEGEAKNVGDIEDAEVEKTETEKEAEPKQYHIKKHDKGWQIIAGDAKKAYRVFDTQKEAIDYAKENELDYLLYRVDGTLRK